MGLIETLFHRHERASLPQTDTRPDDRAAELQQGRKDYQFDYQQVPDVGFARTVPKADHPTIEWWKTVIAIVLRVGKNTVKSEAKTDVRAAADEHQRLTSLLPSIPHAGLAGLALEAIALLDKGRVTGPATSLADFDALFDCLPLPPLARTYDSDETFARLRVAGFNPLTIQQVERLNHGFPVTDAQLAAAVGNPNDNLAAAGAAGRLFLVDYTGLAAIANSSFLTGQKYGSQPYALFALPPGGGQRSLVPVAIQTGPDPGTHAVLTPADGPAWKAAKTAFNSADFAVHELVSHFARTHALIEPFVVSMHRQLAANHPLRILLTPHFEGTLFINEKAVSNLISNGGVIDKIFFGKIEDERAAAVRGLKSYPFTNNFLPSALEGRGVTSTDLEYPYRDDATLAWGAIQAWVASYLSVYYRRDADVRDDRELRAWAAELSAESGGRVVGFGEGGAGDVTTLGYLVDAVTMIIFTASAQHAAVNFPQLDLLQYAPAVPSALYQPPPKTVADGDKQPWLALLPPLQYAVTQQQALYILGSVYHTRLGDYGDWFRDPRVVEPLAVFQENLAAVEVEINLRNTRRPVPYTYLLPSKIPQSINI